MIVKTIRMPMQMARGKEEALVWSSRARMKRPSTALCRQGRDIGREDETYDKADRCRGRQRVAIGP